MKKEKKEKSENIIVALLVLIIIILLVLVSLLLTGTVIFKNGKIDDTITKCKETSNTTDTKDISISILSMEKPIINTETPNHVMRISGKMELSFDENKYSVVNIVGTCYGKDGEKYSIYGPSSGATSFHNGETKYTMVESIGNQDDVIYPDGTKKEHKDIDWTKVEIKSCEIESLKAYSFAESDEILLTRKINYKKEFN